MDGVFERDLQFFHIINNILKIFNLIVQLQDSLGHIAILFFGNF